MFTRILVPLDGSVLAETILPEVVELAALHRAELILLRVALAHTLPGADQAQAQVRAVEEAEAYLGSIARRLAEQGVRASTVVRYGRAAAELLDHLRAGGADCIAMATHGRTGIRRWVLGSVAETVLRSAPVPVLLLQAKAPVAGPAPSAAAAPPPSLQHILCPVDFSKNAADAMQYAGALAQRFGAALTILHAVYDPLDITCSHIPHPPMEQLREELVHQAEHALQGVVRRTLGSLPRVAAIVVAGPPFRQIVQYAREHAVDLIVMGTQGRSGLDHLIMGSTAERVERHAPCPVISIRTAA
jgi:nucleotide-binding universal stress UspA family protein